MAKKAAAAAQELEPEEASQEEPETPGFTLNGRPQETPSKALAVRNALAAGMTDIGDIQDFVKQQYHLDIAKQQVSAYKSQAKSKERGSDPQPRMQAPAQSAGIPSGFGSDVKELRALMEKVGGADELTELIGQLSGLMGKYSSAGLAEIIEAIG